MLYQIHIDSLSTCLANMRLYLRIELLREGKIDEINWIQVRHELLRSLLDLQLVEERVLHVLVLAEEG